MDSKRYSMYDIVTANRVNGGHFFDEKTMKCFRSRVLDDVFQGPGGVFFVTSEQFVDSSGHKAARTYTVRQFHTDTKGVTTVPRAGFEKYKTPGQARSEAEKLAVQEPSQEATA